MEYVHKEIQAYKDTERPVSTILQVENVPTRLRGELVLALQTVDSYVTGPNGKRSPVKLHFYSADATTFLNCNGYMDGVKSIVVNRFFSDFNRRHGTKIAFLLLRPLDLV